MATNFDSQQEFLNRRRQLAQALVASSMQPLQAPSVPGANIHAMEGVAKLAQALFGHLGNRKIDKQQTALDAEVNADNQARIAAVLAGDFGAGFGSQNPSIQNLASMVQAQKARADEGSADRQAALQRLAAELSGKRAESDLDRAARAESQDKDQKAALQRLAIQLSGNRAESDLDRQAKAEELRQRQQFEAAQNAQQWANQLRIAQIRETPTPVAGRDIPLPPEVAAQRKEINATRAQTGRPVTSGDANRIADFDTSLDDLKTLRSEIGKTGATGTSAKVGAMLPNAITDITGWGTDAKKKQAVIDRVKQVIGKALEGGVLRKEDEYKYEKILPTIADPSAVVESKLKGLDEAIAKRRVTLLDSLQDAGYEVSRYRQRDTPAGNLSQMSTDDLLKELMK